MQPLTEHQDLVEMLCNFLEHWNDTRLQLLEIQTEIKK